MIIPLVKEAAIAVVGRIAWKIVLERAMTRLACAAMRRLARMTTNDLDDEVVALICKMLAEKRLPAAKEGLKDADA